MSDSNTNVGNGKLKQKKSFKHGEQHDSSRTGALHEADTNNDGDMFIQPATNVTNPFVPSGGAGRKIVVPRGGGGGGGKSGKSGRTSAAEQHTADRLQTAKPRYSTVTHDADPPEYLNAREAAAIHQRQARKKVVTFDKSANSAGAGGKRRGSDGHTKRSEPAQWSQREFFAGSIGMDEEERPPSRAIPPETLQMDTRGGKQIGAGETERARDHHHHHSGSRGQGEEEEEQEEEDCTIVGSDTSEHDFGYCGSDLQMMKRSMPRRLETDIAGLSHNMAGAESNKQKGANWKEAESQNVENESQQSANATTGGKSQSVDVFTVSSDQGKGATQGSEDGRKRGSDELEGDMNKKYKSARIADESMLSTQKIVHLEDGDDGDYGSDEDDDMYLEAARQAKLPKKQADVTQKQGGGGTKRNVAGNKLAPPKDTPGNRKYIGLSEFERGIPRVDAYGRATTVARGNSALFDMAFVRQDVLDGPPFPFQPPNAIVLWLCRTCRDISNHAKGKRFSNGRTTFIIDMCKPCRILNCEARKCFQDEDEIYGTLKPSDIDKALRKYPYPEQFTPLGGAPFSLTRAEGLTLLMCEHCRLVTSTRECVRDVNGRCRMTIDMCQRCIDANSEMSMALYPTQAELDRQKGRRQYFKGINSDEVAGKVVQTHGKCIRD